MYTTPGCDDSSACNYDDGAGCDDGSCLYEDECGNCGGMAYGAQSNGTNYDAGASCDDDSCQYGSGWISGCTYPNADNYNSEANHDDGSCIYESQLQSAWQNGYDAGIESDAPGVQMLQTLALKTSTKMERNPPVTS